MVTNKNTSSTKQSRPFLLLIVALLVVLALLFLRGWQKGFLVFSNDGPLGQQAAEYLNPIATVTGLWADLNWLGTSGGALSPGISGFLRALLGPVWFSKLFASTALFLLGVGAWFFFRELGFNKTTCVLGGLAAAGGSGAARWRSGRRLSRPNDSVAVIQGAGGSTRSALA